MAHLVLHVGAHGTDGGRIAEWLSRSRELLELQGLVVPAPSVFLRRISDALDKGRNEDPLPREAALLAALGVDSTRRHLAVSTPGLLGASADVLAAEGFYRRDVARRLYALAVLFPSSRITVMLAVGQARTVVPALLPDEPGAAEMLLSAITEETLPWSRLVHAIRAQLPRAGLVVWRTEDFADVWPQVLRGLVGEGGQIPAAGLFDLAAARLGAEARVRAHRYLAHNPARRASQLRDVIATFGRRFGTLPPDAGDRDLPGWLRERLAGLDRGYETEWADLAGTGGVRCLQVPGA